MGKKASKIPVQESQKYVPYRETFEGVVERVESLENLRDEGFTRLLRDYADKLIKIDDEEFTELRKQLSDLENRANQLEEIVRSNTVPLYQTFVVKVKVRCPKCNSPDIIVVSHIENMNFYCDCDDCGHGFEHQVKA